MEVMQNIDTGVTLYESAPEKKNKGVCASIR